MKKIFTVLLSAFMILSAVLPITADNGDSQYKTFMYNDRKSDIKSYEVTYTWNDSWFDKPTEEYNHPLASSLCALCGAAYVDTKPDNILSTLADMGFDGENMFSSYITPTREDNDNVGYVFANKDMGEYNLIAIIIKGTSEDSEWYSNFNIGDGETHEGFWIASRKLYSDLENYITGIGENIKFVITGHSRGAGVANVVAKMLNESQYATKETVFAYTFASPLVSLSATTDGYENIFNILAGSDFVTRLPISQWGYGRWGKDMFLPEKSFADEGIYTNMINSVSVNYSSSTGKNFTPFEGTYSTDNLCREMYSRTDNREDFYVKYLRRTEKNTATFEDYFILMSDILSGNVGISQSVGLLNDYTMEFSVINDYFMDNHISNDRLFSTHSSGAYFYKLRAISQSDLITAGKFFRLKLTGNADVTVTDKNGNILSETSGGKVVKNTLALNISSQEKYIDIPQGKEYTAVVKPVKNGKINISVEILEVAHTEIPVSVKDFYDVDVTLSDEITVKFADGKFTADKNSEEIPAKNEFESDVPVVKIITENEGNGVSYGGGRFRKGEMLTLSADEGMMQQFLGWYDGETLLSKRLSYTFEARNDMVLTAKFTENLYIAGDVNVDGAVNSDDLSYMLECYATTEKSCDLDNNGVVNTHDLSILLSNFGKMM